MIENNPSPPRFRWLKRLSLAGILFVVVMAAARGWWEREAQRRIDALVATTHAAGKPILLEDFVARDISDSDNAAILLKKVEASLQWTAADRNFEMLDAATALPLVPPLMRNHAADLHTLRAARHRKDVEWGMRITRPVLGAFNFSTYNADRKLVHLLQWSAMYEHSVGNDADAIDYLRDCLALANAETRKAPTFVCLLISMGLYGFCDATILDSSSPLVIETPTSAPYRGANRDQISALINALLDERAFREAAERASAGEAMIAMEIARDLPRAEIHPRLLADLLTPIFLLQGERVARRNLSMARAMNENNIAAARSKILPFENFDNASMLQLLARKSEFASSNDNIVRLVFHSIAERRVVATMLALQLYAHDHAGKLPESLSALAPQYLPGVPLDPFAPDGRAIGYLPHRDPPVLYSVGYNGTDEGGSQQPLRAGSTSTYRWDNQDAVFPIRVRTPATGPSDSK